MRERLDRRLIRTRFERAAGTYDGAAALQREVEARLLERLALQRAGPARDPARILDLGAGRGRAAAHLAADFPTARVVAADLARPMLAKAAAAGFDRVCGDAAALPFAERAFDLIVSNLMLQWCEDLLAVLAELRRVLVPKGLLLFTSFGPDTLRELRLAWREVDGAVHVNDFVDMHHVGDALVEAGFDDPVLDVERLTVTYPNVRLLMRDLQAIGAVNVDRRRRRSLTGKRRLLAMETAYEAAFGRDGIVPATYEVVYGHALGPPPGRARRAGGIEEAVFPLEALRGSRRGR